MAKAKATKINAEQDDHSKAKGIFLATLGFYGKVYDDSSSKVKELKEKRSEQIQSFVTRGVEIEDQAKEIIANLKSGDNLISARINSLRESLAKFTARFSTLKFNEKEVNTSKPTSAKKAA